ncbi:MAG: hypothetical protein AB8B87_23020 [Granulosicoccus sp.]
MINSTSSVNIDGTVFNSEDFIKTFTFNKKSDKFSQWVVRPLAALTAIGFGVAAFFASAFLVVLSLALIPLLALSFWAFKTKVERDIASCNPVVDTQTEA